MLTWQNTGDPCAPETLTFVDHLMPTRIGYTTAFGWTDAEVDALFSEADAV